MNNKYAVTGYALVILVWIAACGPSAPPVGAGVSPMLPPTGLDYYPIQLAAEPGTSMQRIIRWEATWESGPAPAGLSIAYEVETYGGTSADGIPKDLAPYLLEKVVTPSTRHNRPVSANLPQHVRWMLVRVRAVDQNGLYAPSEWVTETASGFYWQDNYQFRGTASQPTAALGVPTANPIPTATVALSADMETVAACKRTWEFILYVAEGYEIDGHGESEALSFAIVGVSDLYDVSTDSLADCLELLKQAGYDADRLKPRR